MNLQYERLDLWNATIALLKKTTKLPSPFRNCSYDWHILEPPISFEGEKKDNESSPDFITVRKNYWVISDISLDTEKNWSHFKLRYANLSIRNLSDLACPHYSKTFKTEPTLLITGSEKSITLKNCENEKVSGLVVYPHCKFFYIDENFNDSKLKDELVKIDGRDMRTVPMSILAVPEMHPDELRRPIKGVLLQHVGSENNSFTATDIAIELLQGEANIFSKESQRILTKKVRKSLLNLVQLNRKNKMKLISYNQSTELFTMKKMTNPQSMGMLEKILSEWSASSKHVQESIDDFQ